MNTYRVAGIDVHKKMLAVVVGSICENGEIHFERGKFGTMAAELRRMRQWLEETEVREVVMESTAQYWKPVWLELEPTGFQLHLAQAHSNKAPKGRKQDFADAERLVRRLVAGELTLSFVPDPEQRLWRTVTHMKHQMTRDKVRLVNQLEALLEDCRIKLSSVVSNLRGASSRRMLDALSDGEKDPVRLAKLADQGLRATEAQLADALGATATLDEARRALLKIMLGRLDALDAHIEQLDLITAKLLSDRNDVVARLAEVPGLGVDSAQQLIAEVGPEAKTFDSPEKLASWVGVCPGREESAEVSHSNRSPKGNRAMRRILCQAANAAVKSKGSVFESVYKRLAARIGHKQAIWATAHKLCRIVWKVLHDKASYKELGNLLNPALARRKLTRLKAQLRNLGYDVLLTPREPTAS